MKPIRTFDRVFDFFVTGQVLILASARNVIVRHDGNEICALKRFPDFAITNYTNGFLFVHESEGTTLIINQAGETVWRKENIAVNHLDGTTIIYFDRKGKQTVYENIGLKKVTGTLDKRLGFVNYKGEGYFISTLYLNYQSIVCLDDKSNIIWQYEVPQSYAWVDDSATENQANVERVIGVWKDIVWLSLNSGRLIGLNVISGKTEFDLVQPSTSTGNFKRAANSFLMFGLYSTLDINREVLFGLRGRYYWEIDLQNPVGKFEMYDITESMEHFGITTIGMGEYVWPWLDDHVYFCQQELGDDASNFGVFDRKSKQVTWSSATDADIKPLPGIAQMAASGGRLYVLDRHQVLGVYDTE